MNIKTIIIIVVLFILLNVIGYCTKPAKYRDPVGQSSTNTLINLSKGYRESPLLEGVIRKYLS